MATDHYRQAEAFMIQASRHTDTGAPRDEELARLFYARAQVQATLAVADAVRAIADQQVQVTVEGGDAFQLRGVAVRPAGGAE